MSSSCSDIQTRLIICIKKSDCMKNNKFHECIKHPNDLPHECQQLRTTYFECRRGQVCII